MIYSVLVCWYFLAAGAQNKSRLPGHLVPWRFIGKGELHLLKSVLYYLLLLTTTVRFADMIYLLAKDSTNLPIPVIAVTSLMILYGIFLGVKKFVTTIRMKQMLHFYLVQTGMIVFNLIYVAAFCPLRVSAVETVIVGTFLDVLVNAGLIYACLRQMRSFYLPAAQQVPVAAVSKAQINV